MMKRVKLRDLGHARAGDKGDASIVSFFVYHPEHYDLMIQLLTGERVKEHFDGLVASVKRYEVPSLHAFNFVMEEALGGGVTGSLSLDPHGKSRSFLLLQMEVEVPDWVAPGQFFKPF
jgi:hypothetical protein